MSDEQKIRMAPDVALVLGGFFTGAPIEHQHKAEMVHPPVVFVDGFGNEYKGSRLEFQVKLDHRGDATIEQTMHLERLES